jgi:hypothetical protein
MNAPGTVLGFRLVASAAAAAMLMQAVLAGLALSGRPAALNAHMFNGAAVFVLSAAEVVIAILLRRAKDLPRWALVASAVLLLGQILQMLSGRFHLLSVHIPLGVGLFGLMMVLAYWAWVASPESAGGNADTRESSLAPKTRPEC